MRGGRKIYKAPLQESLEMKLLIIGPQASGKGTQANRIAKHYGIPHFSTGDLLRAEKASGSALGREIAARIDQGEMVPDELIWNMVKPHLDAHPEGWILDGYPRTIRQAEILDDEVSIDHVILLDVPDEVCIERISGRRICTRCGHIYHLKYSPPRREGVCDLDGAPLKLRADDTPAAVKKRLADYHLKTAPLIDHYAAKLIRIDGRPGIEEVWTSLRAALDTALE